MSISTEIEKINHHHHHSSHSEDEDESLSLSDLPLLSSTRHEEEENQQRLELIHQSEAKSAATEDFDFDFGSLSASLDALESEMCIADEVFYRGQILPFRHSVSSASTTPTIPRSVSRSESMDRIAGSGFRSSSTASTSRSSSTRSSSINSSASADKLSQRHSNYTKNSNPYHHHRHMRASKAIQNQSVSPMPYTGPPHGPRRSTSSAQSPIKKSALWEFFRLGLVQTPEIELEDLKFRYSKNHGNGAVRSGSCGDGKSVIKEDSESGKNVIGKKKKGGMRLMKSCKCSVEAVEPEKAGSTGRAVVVGKRKQEVTRHHRTFEWLRDLSHAVVLNDV